MSIKTERRLSRLFIVLGAALSVGYIALGCASTGGSRFPIGRELAPDAETAGLLDEGRISYMTACAECHRRYGPGDSSPDDWRVILKRHRGRVSLATERFDNLEDYLINAADRLRCENKGH